MAPTQLNALWNDHSVALRTVMLKVLMIDDDGDGVPDATDNCIDTIVSVEVVTLLATVNLVIATASTNTIVAAFEGNPPFEAEIGYLLRRRTQ